MPNIFIVIPTYNGARFIREALGSVLAQTQSPQDIIVVDNASTDGTFEIVEREFPQVTLIRKPTNSGFGQASNLGIQYALDAGADFVWLLNQDLTIGEHCLERLASAAAEFPTFGLLSAFQLTYDGQAIDPAFGAYMPPEFWDDLLFRQPKTTYESHFMPAAAVLLSRNMLCEVGGFDPLFFMYGEDNDLCRRIISAGWKIGVVPNARVRHWNSIVNKQRTWRWHCNFEYSHAVLHLKTSPRPLPVAFGTLTVNWTRAMSWRQRLARIPAYVRCLISAHRIAKHRKTIPFSFAHRTFSQSPASSLGVGLREPWKF